MRTVSSLYHHSVSLLIVGWIIAAVACSAEPGPNRVNAQEIKNSVGMKLVFIPPGKFLMGSQENESGREAQEVQHEVELTKGFYLGTHEVTVGQFKQFVADAKFQTDGERDGKGAYGANEAGKIEEMHARFTWKSPGFEQTDNHPVVDVSWSDAKAFCKWLSEKEKKTYRLPTEAEWEYACRAGTKTAYVHGDDPEGLATTGNGADATARAKFPGWSIGIKGQDGHLFTAPVGQFKANPFGLFDMHGNVWEWCEDWYVPNSYSKEKQVDPTGPATGQAKVQRGGGWSSDFKRLRSAARVGRDSVAYRGCYQGFRVVLDPQPRQEQAAKTNPQVIAARDAKLAKDFEYLVFDLGQGVEFRLVKLQAKGQTFRIGSSKQEQVAVLAKYFGGKNPAHGKLDLEDEQPVTLTDDFFLGQYEVTRGQFRRFVEETGYQTIPELTDGGKGWDAKEQKFVGADKRFSWRDTGLDFQTDDYPVVNVAIDDARKFCEWLLKKCDGRTKVREVRLPGEAEWEFACRAGSQTRFFFGDDDERLVEFANVADAAAREKKLAPVTLNGSDGFPFSAPVGRLQPNPFGLYDMHGNVWEFCEDFYGKYSALPKERNALQTVQQGEIRPVMRGGAWHLTGSDCRCANRFIVGSTGRYATGGFRVLCLP
ncbi:MAG: formylglycine-generating enzyme family protein [Planctomycetes bacterium]|nr:formylglycine-generating enzyme family protein [Planctomycetota bacterium]